MEVYFYNPNYSFITKTPLQYNNMLSEIPASYGGHISDIQVNENYSLSDQNGYKVIEIMADKNNFEGEKNFEISYIYDLGNDVKNGCDLLFFPLIFESVDTDIENFNFHIELPKDFDTIKINFLDYKNRPTNLSNLSYNLNGNIIEGKNNKKLHKSDKIYMKIELPDGYFLNKKYKISKEEWLYVIIPILFLVIAIIMLHKNNKGYPKIKWNNNLNSDELLNSKLIKYMYCCIATTEVPTFAIFSLAQKGYIKIKETYNIKQDGIIILRLKDYDGDDKIEKIVYDGLFKDNNYIENGEPSHTKYFNKVTSYDLENNFFPTIDKIVDTVSDIDRKEKFHEDTNTLRNAFLYILMIVTYLITTIPLFASFGNAELTIFSLLLEGNWLLLESVKLFITNEGVLKTIVKSSILDKILTIMFGLPLICFAYIMYYLPLFAKFPLYIMIHIVGCICIISMQYCYSKMKLKPAYKNSLNNEIKKIKNKISTMSKDELEEKTMSDPMYLYKIFPYIYILDMEEIWIEKCNLVTLGNPYWLEGNGIFNKRKFIDETVIYLEDLMDEIFTKGEFDEYEEI